MNSDFLTAFHKHPFPHPIVGQHSKKEFLHQKKQRNITHRSKLLLNFFLLRLITVTNLPVFESPSNHINCLPAEIENIFALHFYFKKQKGFYMVGFYS